MGVRCWAWLEMIGDRYEDLITRLGGTGSYARREAGRIE